MLGALCIVAWSMVLTAAIFLLLRSVGNMNVNERLLGIERMTEVHELMGADWSEHHIRSETFAVKLDQALSKLPSDSHGQLIEQVQSDTILPIISLSNCF